MDSQRTLDQMYGPNQGECFGREHLCESIQNAVLNKDGGILFFGGVMTGKTAILLKIKSTLENKAKASLASLDTLEVIIPVYRDLRGVPGADSNSLFDCLLSDFQTACEKFFPEFSSPPRDSKSYPLDIRSFAARIDQIFASNPDFNFRILYLLDNCEHFRNFPKGLQANLGWLLYGEDDRRSRTKIAMIMAGSQQMHDLLVDPVTVFATRATQEYICNLSHLDVANMVRHYGLAESIATDVYQATGGHAGLTRMLIEEMAGRNKSSDVHKTISKLATDKEEVFARIKRSLSPEANSIQRLLFGGNPVSKHDVESHLRASDLDGTKWKSSLRELVFNGIAVIDSATITPKSQVRPAGQLYWEYYAENSLLLETKPTFYEQKHTNSKAKVSLSEEHIAFLVQMFKAWKHPARHDSTLDFKIEDVSEVLALLEWVVRSTPNNSPTNGKYDRLGDRMLGALVGCLDTPPKELGPAQDHTEQLVLSLEPFCMKILSLLEPERFLELHEGKQGLACSIKELQNCARIPYDSKLSSTNFESPEGWELRSSYDNAVRDVVPARLGSAHGAPYHGAQLWHSAVVFFIGIIDKNRAALSGMREQLVVPKP
jgi:hypothetical protein